MELVQAQRSYQSRASAFRDALAAIGSDGTPANSNMATSLKLMIDREEKDGGDAELKIEDAKARKEALEQFVANLSGMRTNNGPPPRRPDYDYSHKDLREGTDIYSVRELLRKTGKPMLLLDIVTQLFGSQLISLKEGKYANLRGTLTGYAREGRIFTIESKSPHVIGLIEFKNLPKQ